jgi:glutamyl-Q tRNA(Asp) synthetase
VLKRADGFWAYQLAVVVDDADQGITHIVRGTDLLESTGRQIYLQRLLGLPTPSYMHVPVVLNEVGEKLSKQTGATALDTENPLSELLRAAHFLQLEIGHADSIAEFWQKATTVWARRFGEMIR